MNAEVLIFSILLPVVAGVFCLFIKRKGIKEGITIGVSALIFILSIFLFIKVRTTPIYWTYHWFPQLNIDFSLKCYGFSSTILLFISFFGLITSLYSLSFMKKSSRLCEYYAYFLWVLGVSWGTVLANNLVVFLLFWGMLGVLLYSFLSLGSYKLATKGIFTIGVADFSLILGSLFLFKLSGTLNMESISRINLTGAFSIVTFILLATGAIAKIGSLPFHTWIPDASEQIPPPAMAYIPASLDKLIGIYLLFRICSQFFDFTAISLGSFFLMIIGAFTIVVAVMMALVSSNIKRIVAYFNISAAGYMMMGVATARPTGMAGGLFYLFSTAIWTSLLFFTTGSVENRTGTSELSSLGGVARWMPLTSTGCLIGGLAISGVPPFNGFFSKWMIYQGIIELGTVGGVEKLWIIWLSAAMFGSVITLASFMRMFYSVFLSEVRGLKVRGVQDLSSARTFSNPGENTGEVGIFMNFPVILLAVLCVLFGVLAYGLPLKFFVVPYVSRISGVENWMGWWQPGLATVLIIVGLVGGALFYLFTRVRLGREDVSYIGGEEVQENMVFTGVRFYDTVANFVGLRRIYQAAEKGFLDIYQGMLAFSKGIAYFLLALDRLVDYLWRAFTYLVLLAGKGASLAHNGILHTYLAWFLVGLIILMIVFSL